VGSAREGIFRLFRRCGLIGASLAEAADSEAFRRLALAEIAAVAPDRPLYRTEREPRLALAVGLYARRRAAVLLAALDPGLLEGRDRPHGLDALNTLVAEVARGPGAPPELGALVGRIEAEIGAPTAPPPSLAIDPACALIAGRPGRWRAVGPRIRLTLARGADRGVPLILAATERNAPQSLRDDLAQMLGAKTEPEKTP